MAVATSDAAWSSPTNLHTDEEFTCLLIHASPVALVRTPPRAPARRPQGSTSTPWESIDGTGNNDNNPLWGSAGTDLLRLAAAAYADGVSAPALAGDRSARAISNLLNDQADPANPSADLATVDQNSLTDYGYVFGQFMDHDMDLTPDGGAALPIAVAPGDPIGPNPIPFTRSQTDPLTGTSTANPAQQVTTITSYLDLSQVYGSSDVVARALRTMSGGLMKTSPGNMLPYDNTTYFTRAQIKALNMANDSGVVPTSQLFATGDRRGNENIELTALQTLFVRNHNQLVAQLQALHPNWGDNKLYQEARMLNIAVYQNIVYNAWIPAVMGANALPPYSGYDPSVNATISNEFSTVAFRFGHSLLSADIERQNNDGSDIADVNPNGSDISLAEAFFNPNLLNPTSAVDPLTGHTSSDIDPVLKALAGGVSQATDLMATSAVRNQLFGNGGAGGEDLMARDVQRDRDNGIPDYNSLRVALGLPAVTSFAQISSDPKVRKALAMAYPGGVNTIDAFEGGLAETHVAGSDVGPLFQKIMVDQFARLRSGDDYYYLSQQFSREERGFLQSEPTLTSVIEANTNLTNLQDNAFVFNASIGGHVSNGRNRFAVTSNLTVKLEDDSGNVLATTLTDQQGNYTFTQLSGPSANPEIASGVSATGTYRVVLLLSPGGDVLTSDPVVITRGDTYVMGIDFTLPSSHN